MKASATLCGPLERGFRTSMSERTLGSNFASCRKVGSQIPGLFEWPRAGDADIYRSPGALLPVGAGRHAGDADKNPK